MTNKATEYFSQFGEDRILDDIFKDKDKGVCVEVGGNDGITGSTTYYFERKGWKCLLVEPIPALVEAIKSRRVCDVSNYAASSEEGDAIMFTVNKTDGLSTLHITDSQQALISGIKGIVKEISVKKKTLDKILLEHGIKDIDFITIDVEGHELEVLKGFSVEHYKPTIIILEDNDMLSNPTIFNYMRNNRYIHFRRTGVNDWYAHESNNFLFDVNEIELLETRRKRSETKRKIIDRFSWITPYIPRPIKDIIGKMMDAIIGIRN